MNNKMFLCTMKSQQRKYTKAGRKRNRDDTVQSETAQEQQNEKTEEKSLHLSNIQQKTVFLLLFSRIRNI